MAGAAVQTSAIRLATGVLIPSDRIAPVTASALASLNALAPGRIDFGISTGFTGCWYLGLGPVKLGGHGRVRARRAGATRPRDAQVDPRGHSERSASCNPEVGAINLDDPIPLHVAANGPAGAPARCQARRGPRARDGQHRPCRRRHRRHAGRLARGRLAIPRICTRRPPIGGSILNEGEAADSPRARAQAGPTATVALHSLVKRDQLGPHARPDQQVAARAVAGRGSEAARPARSPTPGGQSRRLVPDPARTPKQIFESQRDETQGAWEVTPTSAGGRWPGGSPATASCTR